MRNLLPLVLGLFLVIGGCTSPAPSAADDASRPIKIALVPSEDAEKMIQGFEPLRAQLAQDLGRDVEMIKVTDYGSVIEAMRGGKVDLAWYGPLSMVLANREAGSEPFAVPLIVGKGKVYHALFVVKADSPFKTLADLRGKKCALVDPGSTSGNLVPRNAIQKEFKAKAEDFFGEITYAGSHDASLLALTNGSVDVCAVQDITVNSETDAKRLDPKTIRVLYTSEDLPPSPLAVRKGFDAALLKKVQASFLKMDKVLSGMDVPGMGKIQSFEASTMKDFQPIADMATNLGLTPEQMKK